ncbi:GntR family transcriptional regulator [Streptomyces sp. NPDC002690]
MVHDRQTPRQMGPAVSRAVAGLRKLLADTATYPPGSKLPTYQTMMAMVGTGAPSVRKAVLHLIEENALVGSEGGPTVAGAPPLHPRLRPATVEKVIRARINDGTYPQDQRIPSLRALKKELGVPSEVLRKALDPLVGEGILEIRSGTGCFVRAPRSIQRARWSE